MKKQGKEQTLWKRQRANLGSKSEKKETTITNYSIHAHQLKEVKGAKYLGVTIDRTLSWNDHINNVTKKANNTRAFLQRNISRCPDVCQVHRGVCVDGVRSVYREDLLRIHVQRQAARFVKSDYRRRSSVTTMIESLNWIIIASRQAEATLAMLYRIANNLVDVTTPAFTAAPTRTRGNTHRYLNHPPASKLTNTPSFRASSNYETNAHNS